MQNNKKTATFNQNSKIEHKEHNNTNITLDYAYSPINTINDTKQRIKLPKKRPYIYYGTRILKN
jgi:hypothetical protein